MQITSTAVRKVREMGDKNQPEGYGLRVIVDVGGPEGFFYDLDFETQSRADDIVTVADGLTVYVDAKSHDRFKDGTIDYVETTDFAGFHFDNPNKPAGPGDASALSERIQWVLDTEINPAVAGHGGNVSLVEVQDNNVFLRFGGGCHGCSASAATLKHGIEERLRAKFPDLGEIVDATDHSTGANPYFA
ncbi:MAG: iron-sulfur cluster assembly accessory protein [Myxococcales bacterium]|nr:iron-sulfur cluster assembly accessory protein [Myxococcales bacterium]